MNSHASEADRPIIGDFAALLAQLEKPSDRVAVVDGYSKLLGQVNSADYRRRCGLVSH